MKPLAIDLFTGLHGWSEGLVAEGFRVVGFDIEDMCKQFGEPRPEHVQLVIQDVLTLHGSQFKTASLIVASPPCQEFSYMAMPWSLAKAKRARLLEDAEGRKRLTALFDACFRIQREACEAAGRHIPLIVENVRGACEWVGRSRWNYGSFHLWGDVPALMPMTKRGVIGDGMKAGDRNKGRKSGDGHLWDSGFDEAAGRKVPGFRFDGSGKSFQTASVEGVKGVPHKPTGHWTNPAENGAKIGGDWFNDRTPGCHAMMGSKSKARKAASAKIAKIPLPLALHIARVFKADSVI